MRKNILKIIALVGILIFTITGCSNVQENQRSTPKATVDLFEGENVNKTEDSNDIDNNENQKEENGEATEKQNHRDVVEDEDVDYDLTTMSNDMVYALVYQMMVSPDDYIGKTIKMSGIYYAAYDESIGQYYHYVIIKDAMACCAQGLEFVWEDGKHIYPDEYPADETEVEVVGVFETYRDDGDPKVYCRLTNSQLKLLDK